MTDEEALQLPKPTDPHQRDGKKESARFVQNEGQTEHEARTVQGLVVEYRSATGAG